MSHTQLYRRKVHILQNGITYQSDVVIHQVLHSRVRDGEDINFFWYVGRHLGSFCGFAHGTKFRSC